MSRQIVLLRGINLGPTRRVPMAELRELLSGAGFEHVRTYLQSGNVVLSSEMSPDELERQCERLIEDRFGFAVTVMVRTREDLAEVVRRNPLAQIATNPKRYQVTFVSDELDPQTLEELSALAAPAEQLVAVGREIYAWHPDGVARSKLWARLAGERLGVTATSRNWTTVTSLLAMANES